MIPLMSVTRNFWMGREPVRKIGPLSFFDFRKANAARQRHRFYRKGKYQMNAHGMVGCVGCGRGAEACLVGINPVETFNELARRRIPMTRRHQESLT